MSTYEQLRRRHVADMLGLVPSMVERLDWSAERLAEERTRRLRRFLLVAQRSAWHRSRLEGIDVERVDEASLGELPVMTKNELMDHFDDMVTDPGLRLDVVDRHLEDTRSAGYLLGRYSAIASSGSTGRRGVFVYGWREWAIFYLSTARQLIRAVRDDAELGPAPVPMAHVAASNPTHATAAIGRTFSPSRYLHGHRFPVTLSVEEIVAGLNETQPVFLHGYASMLHLLTSEARAGRLRISPRWIWSSAEPLLPEIRADLEATWGVPVGNLWGTSEAGGVAVGCRLGSTHLNEDLCIVEAVDGDGCPVEPGIRSAKVYLTNLYNETMPLIRYEITDEVTILPDPCPCGSAYRRVADIHGRLDDIFVYGAVAVHPHVFRSPLARRSGIVEYQVRQTERGAVIAVRSLGPLDAGSLAGEVAAGLARVGVAHPEVTIDVVPRLGRQATGKLKRFVPLAPAPALAAAG